MSTVPKMASGPAISHHLRRVAGTGLFLCLVLLAAVGPWLAGHDAVSQDLEHVLEPPSASHLLGTDHLGRDVLSRLAQAVRLSLRLAMLCLLSSAVPGTALGVLAAWRGGWTEQVLVMLADIVQALPGLLLILLLAAFAPGELWPLYVGVALLLWVEYFRVVRAMSRSLLASPQVEASRLLGFGAGYIVKRHLLPELLPVVGTLMSFGAATAVLVLAGTGFVGVGLQPPTPELGLMMIELLPYYDEAPWLIGAPIGILTIFLFSLLLLAGGKDPR